MSERGCYLTYDVSSQGSFYINWSNTKIENSLCFFCPSEQKPVPNFKFQSNGGKTELSRNCGGVNIKIYYQAWLSFVKLCRDFSGTFHLYDSHLDIMENRPIKIYILSNNIIVRIESNEPISLEKVNGIAVVHSSTSCFEAKTMTPSKFNEVGNENGAAMIF